MKSMKSIVLSQWDLPWLSNLALLLFVSVFVFMLFLIFRKGSKSYFEKIGQIPLNDEKGKSHE